MRFGITPQALWGPDLPGPHPTRLPQDNHRLGSPTSLRPRVAGRSGVGRFLLSLCGTGIPLATPVKPGRVHSGTGISTGCASTTPVGLALAPDSPWED